MTWEKDDEFENEKEVFKSDRPIPVWPKNHFFILDENNQPVPTDDLAEWSEFFQNDLRRRVGATCLNGLFISTVFLGLDHNLGFGGRPIFFETMIFKEENNAEIDLQMFDQYQMRYSTWDEALKGHQHMVTIIREGLF